MSRIGNTPLKIPNGVTVNITNDNQVKIQGPKGTLGIKVNSAIQLKHEGDILTLARTSSQKKDCALHGLSQRLLNNMIIGVTKSHKKTLEIIGIGYGANVESNLLLLNLGKSHVTYLKIPKEITITAESVKGKTVTTHVHIEGVDKQLVGQVAAVIRKQRPPNAYITKRGNTQKGIRYLGEMLIGKTKKDSK